MKTKICEHCEKEFEAKRNDARYCGSTCRSLAWMKSQTEVNDGNPLRSQLRGLVSLEQSNNDSELSLVKKELRWDINPEYFALRKAIMQNEKDYKSLENEKQMLIKRLEKEKFSSFGGLTIPGLGIGVVGGYTSAKEEEEKLAMAVKFGLIGGVGGFAMDLITLNNRKKTFLKTMQEINVRINSIKDKQTFITNKLQKLKEHLKTIPSSIQREVEIKPKLTEPVLQNNNEKNIDENKRLLNVNPSSDNVNKRLAANKPLLKIPEGSKIISSSDLANMHYDILGFTGRWLQLFGEPSMNFHCIIYGLPGEGKSTFAIQFAKYLAEHMGRVVYISGEEGFAKTLRDKFINNDSISNFLDVADLRTYDDIVNNIPVDLYNFIFVDSLDNMRIDADKMKRMRERYKDSALITISQSTKEGKVRGSQELVHDCDISVSVENGIAKTEKNRFKEKWMTYEVF